MRRIRQYRDAIAASAGILAPIAVAAALVPSRRSFASAAAALVLVAVVVAVAANGSRFAGWLASASAALSFDFFLTKPYERLAISHRPDIETAVSLFVVGIAVTELAARGRHQHHVAQQESDFVALLYDLSELVAAGAPVNRVIERSIAALIELLHLRGCEFANDLGDGGLNRIDHDGQVNLGRLRWGVDRMGLPGKQLELLVQNRGKLLGRFILTPTPGWPVPMERRVVAVAVADQVGAALMPHLRSA